MADRSVGQAAPGFVSIVGAGPGDPELLTLRAIQRLRSADLVLYDGLVPTSTLGLASSAKCVSVSKRVGVERLTQDEVNALMIAAARRGERVVRLKAGDPFVLGRGGEEAIALSRAGVPYEVVPGLTTATAAPALAGIPVTHRGVVSGFVVTSGHSPSAYTALLGSLAPGSATVVVLMGMAERVGIRQCLIGAGWRPDTPAAIVSNASQPDQRTWTGTLAALDSSRDFVPGDDAGVIVVGDVVLLETELRHLERVLDTQETVWQPTTIHRR